MSNTARSTVSTVFDLQRTMLEQTQAAFKQGVDVQKRAGNAFLESLESQQSVQESSVTLFQRAVHAYLDALEQLTPGDQFQYDEVRSVVDQQFEQMDEVSEESWTALKRAMEEGFDAVDTMTDAYVEAVDSSFDAFLDTYEQVEAQAIETADATAEAVQIDVEAE